MSVTVHQLADWLNKQMNDGIVNPNAKVVIKRSDDYEEYVEEEINFNSFSSQKNISFTADGKVLDLKNLHSGEEKLVINISE